ncbi:MAG TPA: NAD-dependent DNA ligase LigA [Spirochaetia bacterium]|nr:NAD-dependent DNA ligase LigA [Spirochaetales bacterium]HRS65547.1 NAD-dependent DNA ligase LigA [Spirochaetia bacterium]HOT59979.1 NAD-dependent DNA ligase LigA [Spirochaetales bacterium]HPD81211.1 NAD-dependent DNA ligase LigA [Spirochaetales bacterium]HQK34566.1 NAD-dependent DNA ligase LigA [Spirochaetales bacterium]
MDKQKRIQELENLVKYHQNAYYNGMPEITDAEFDALWDELKTLDPGNKIFSEVGKDSADGFLKREHIMPMGSQDKAADPEEFLAWAQKQQFREFVVEYKLDGASLELQYRDGVLQYAVTRGDGTIGDDITENVRKMQGVVLRLKNSWSGAVRGEVIMLKSIHSQFFSDKANCRNAANGVMKRKDGKGSEHLSVLCYDAVPEGVFNKGKAVQQPESPFNDEISKLEWLKEQGFSVVPAVVCNGAYEVIDYRAKVVAERELIPYDIDGLVVKGRVVDINDMAQPRPEKQIAFKFPLEEAVSTLRSIEWSESGILYTPIALIDPVQLAGTVVKRANLVNTNAINGMGLKIGSRVIVVKRGEIIPKIEGKIDDEPGAVSITIPEFCGQCNTRLIDEGTRLYCPNSSCPGKLYHRLEKWIQTMGIMDIGPTVLKRLFETGKVRTIADLYKLTIADLIEIERMGEILAKKIIANINVKKSIKISVLLAGLDIDGIGPLMAEKLISAGFTTLEKLKQATSMDFVRIPGFGTILAENLVQGLKELESTLNELLLYISIEQTNQGSLQGLSFCFTGELKTMKRAEAESLVRQYGGTVKSSVTKDLSYLVTNDPNSGSSKNMQAKKLGIPVISEDNFLLMIKSS